jgi:hypothetical protein
MSDLSVHKKLKNALNKLEAYIQSEQYYGYDPYDALQSPLFLLPWFKSNKSIRLVSQQLIKRSPINVRPLLAIPKGYNPVTLGLCLHGYTSLMNTVSDQKGLYKAKASFCISEIERLHSKGFSGACWGYDFDWEARYARIQAYTPTVVATGIITNSLFYHYQATKDDQCLDLCKSAARFVRNDLNKTSFGETFCYSYSPLDKQVVLNATMKGARLLAQIYSITSDPILIEEARKSVGFVIEQQDSNGSWPYSLGDKRSWSDNFHTGYVLDCLDEYTRCINDSSIEKSIISGFNYYVKNFFEDDRIPKYFNNKLFPIDSTAAAQAIFTLTKFNELEKATNVAIWMIDHMQSDVGFFYYQKNRFWMNRISYMRWSCAWMFSALAYLLNRLSQ